MSQPQIGEMLKKTVRLTDLDVEEILHEQRLQRRRFGQIALAWGLCTPRDIWLAWFNQLGEQTPLIDLNQIGVDAQAVAQVPRDVAMQFNLIPIRVFSDQLFAAIPADAPASPIGEIARILRRPVRLVHADARQIHSAIDAHYGCPSTPA